MHTFGVKMPYNHQLFGHSSHNQDPGKKKVIEFQIKYDIVENLLNTSNNNNDRHYI